METPSIFGVSERSELSEKVILLLYHVILDSRRLALLDSAFKRFFFPGVIQGKNKTYSVLCVCFNVSQMFCGLDFVVYT